MIYDRTLQDVEDAKEIRTEKVQQFETLTQADEYKLERGFFTVNTLNRIEDKQDDLKIILHSCGYFDREYISKTWDSTDWFFLHDWQRILHNLNIIRKGIFSTSETPKTPDAGIDYVNLNAVEKILYDVESIINEMEALYRECGTFECGE